MISDGSRLLHANVERSSPGADAMSRRYPGCLCAETEGMRNANPRSGMEVESRGGDDEGPSMPVQASRALGKRYRMNRGSHFAL